MKIWPFLKQNKEAICKKWVEKFQVWLPGGCLKAIFWFPLIQAVVSKTLRIFYKIVFYLQNFTSLSASWHHKDEEIIHVQIIYNISKVLRIAIVLWICFMFTLSVYIESTETYLTSVNGLSRVFNWILFIYIFMKKNNSNTIWTQINNIWGGKEVLLQPRITIQRIIWNQSQNNFGLIKRAI